MKVSAVLLAGGVGQRFSEYKKKQFYVLKKLPLIMWSIFLLENEPNVFEIVIVCEKKSIPTLLRMLKNYNINKIKSIVPGGETSIESAINGLNAINEEECDKVIFHEAVRPFITKNELSSLIELGKTKDCVCCASDSYESILICGNNNRGTNQIDRKDFKMIHMPQMYNYDLINKVLKKAHTDHAAFASLNLAVASHNHSFYFSNCSRWNIKITTKDDLKMAKLIAKHFIV